MSNFREKLLTIAAPRKIGTARTIIKRDERDGSVAGTEREHWNDRVDVTVTPKPIRAKFSIDQGG